jgi:hypothetical protein
MVKRQIGFIVAEALKVDMKDQSFREEHCFEAELEQTSVAAMDTKAAHKIVATAVVFEAGC